MLFLLLALSVVQADAAVTNVADGDNGASIVWEVDLGSGDSPLVGLAADGGINLVAGRSDRAFRTAPYLRVNEQHRVQLALPRRRPLVVGHVEDHGKGAVALCRGWMNEVWCEATLKVDQVRGTQTLEIVVPRPDGTLRAAFTGEAGLLR